MPLVALLIGGCSKEREVSLVSGIACAAGLREVGFDVLEIDVGPDIAARLGELKPAVCFNAMHGPIGEDGSIQGLLNVLDIPYTHSGVAASAIAMHKPYAKLVAQSIGVRTGRGLTMDRETFFGQSFTDP